MGFRPHSLVRMLKKALSHPPNPVRAETRTFPGCVLGSSASSPYPTWGKSPSWRARGGWVKRYASGAAFACGLVGWPF